ncbi:glutaredoxin [Coprinellus micaceus]|uniref:Glutaredoxin n=1 Tax=Coprinellus micaceus TaxID=71717 RepID=A0A4Y7TE44_COPMI|nr:glutaredoxin [Coprinellus micaceus]
MSSSKEIVESAIEKSPIVIFSKSWCPYCRRAKALLKEKFADVEQTIFELDERADGDEIQAYLLTKTKQRTVPNIFVQQQHIGGCDDTTAAVASGKVAGLLKA